MRARPPTRSAPAVDAYYRTNLVRHLLKGGRLSDVDRLLRLEQNGTSVWFAVRQANDEERGWRTAA